MKYLKMFENHTSYETYMQGGGVALPNVSYCVSEGDVHYNPIVPPKNIIRYTSESKLNEITYAGDDTGLYIYGFSGSSGQQLSITSHTFENGIGTIEFDDDVTIIGVRAFNGSQLSSIDIPNYITTISDNAFDGCNNLTSVTIPDSVTSIGTDAFYGCTSLTSVTIGSGVTIIGQSAFYKCSSLTSIIVDSDNVTYDSRNNCNAIIETSTNKLISGCKNTIIPNSVTSIDNGAFYSCSGLTSVTIPDSVTSIGGSAFQDCSGLTSVTIGSGVTSIGDYAFSACKSLTSVIIPNSVTSIGGNAFNICSGLTSVTIGSGVTSIGNNAFSNCSGLTTITCNVTAAPTIGSSTFRNVKTGGTLYVPTGSTGYDTWMQNANYYLGKKGWTKVEQ